jgi:hypothetical protein
MSEQSIEQDSVGPPDTSGIDAADAVDAVHAIDATVDAGAAAVLVGGLDAGADKPLDLAALPLNCLNCGAAVRGRYCLDCGQPTDTHVPTLPELLGDYLVGILNLDSRIWRTLRALLFHPGKLTQEYLAGKRARYILPLRLYIAMSIIFFLVAALPEPSNDLDELDPELFDGVAVTLPGGEEVTLPQQVQQEVADEIEAARAAEAEALANPDEDAARGCNFTFASEAMEARLEEACLEARADDFEKLRTGFLDNMALMAFLVIPVMAAVFKLFYLFTGRGYLEHLAFLCHTHAFTLLLFAFIDLVADVGNFIPSLTWPIGVLLAVLMLYVPAYYYKAMRRVYGQGRGLTLAKLLPLFMVYATVTTLVFSIGALILLMAG